MDDNKVSHTEERVVEDLVNGLKKHFGGLLVARAKRHTFWCMHIYITEEKKVDIEKKYQFSEAIEAFVENMDERLTTPSSSHLL